MFVVRLDGGHDDLGFHGEEFDAEERDTDPRIYYDALVQDVVEESTTLVEGDARSTAIRRCPLTRPAVRRRPLREEPKELAVRAREVASP